MRKSNGIQKTYFFSLHLSKKLTNIEQISIYSKRFVFMVYTFICVF